MHGMRWVGVCAFLVMVGIVLPAYAGDGDIVITIRGGKFVPSEVPVPAGRKLKIIVRNQNTTMSEFESSDFHREETVPPGGQITVFIDPLNAGSYEFFDDFHPEDRGHLVAK